MSHKMNIQYTNYQYPIKIILHNSIKSQVILHNPIKSRVILHNPRRDDNPFTDLGAIASWGMCVGIRSAHNGIQISLAQELSREYPVVRVSNPNVYHGW